MLSDADLRAEQRGIRGPYIPSSPTSALLKLYIHGYLNRVQSTRRLEREAGRYVEV
jgi:hypothetical protein